MPKIDYKPLCLAIQQRDHDLLRSLAKEDPKAAQHWKPITDAAFAGSAECIALLAECGADVNVVSGTASRHTPLTRLCQFHTTIPKHEGHVTALRKLLQLGADPAIVAGPLSLRPLCYAAMGPLDDLIEVLYSEEDSFDLWSSAVLCDLKELKRLAQSTDLAVTDEQGRNALHYVALSGVFKSRGISVSIECSEFLLNQNLDVNATQPIPEGDEVFHASPLWYAVSWQSNEELTAFLLGRGADPNPAVFAALWGGNLTICELLDKHGADWNQQFEGYTPLMEMIRYKRTKLIPWLLERDVDLSAVNEAGETAFEQAKKRGIRKDIVELLSI